MLCKMAYRLHTLVFSISLWFLSGKAVLFQNNFGMITDKPPKDSCQTVPNTENKGKCMMNCLAALDVHYMFSYNEDLGACLCCKDLSGSDVISPGWETFVPRICKDGYITYNYTDFQICLKYVPDSVRYSQARAHCEADGGDLIRIDSTLKYDIFKEMLTPFTSLGDIQVWIQAIKVGQDWRFHDGSPLTGAFPFGMSNGSSELHLRSISQYSYKCFDAPESSPYHYVCEYYRQFI